MTTFFKFVDELNEQRKVGADVFGVEYFSKSNPSVRHYVSLRNEQELTNLKEFHREYDFQFNVLAV
jgi:hypothetical protein